MKHRWSIPVVIVLWVITQPIAFTQTPVTQNPLEGNRDAIRDGGAMFRQRCAGCHGPDARGDRGPDLTGLWASGVSDDRIFQTVRRGVPGSEMPAADPSRVPDRDIWQVLAYVHTLAGSDPPQAFAGTPENGERIFQKTCRTCHMVNGAGGVHEAGVYLTRTDPAPGAVAETEQAIVKAELMYCPISASEFLKRICSVSLRE